MNVVVCGSRDYTNSARIAERIRQLPADAVVHHGGARGADRLAAGYALAFRHEVHEHEADWEKHGRRAGYLRNLDMLHVHPRPELVIAFWDGESKGTKHMIDMARERGIPVEVIA